MNRSEYSAYLASDDWKRRREALIVMHGSRCWLCGIPRRLANLFDAKDLNVHHKPDGYSWIGQERPEHVEARCQLCHGREHGHCDARMYRDRFEWAILDFLVTMFQVQAKPFPLTAPAELLPSYIAVVKKFKAGQPEIDIAFAQMWRRSRGQFPNVTDFAAELEALRTGKAA